MLKMSFITKVLLTAVVCLGLGVSGCPKWASPNSFSLSASPATESVLAGGTALYTVSVSAPKQASGTATFSTAGLPAGATASFQPASLSAAGNTNMTITTTAATPAGTYTFTVNAVAGAYSKSTTATITVTASTISPLTGNGSPANQPVMVVGQPYSLDMGVLLMVSGGVVPYHWTASGLPSGIVITDAGVVQGTPTTAQTYSASITIKDSAQGTFQQVGTGVLSGTVLAPMTFVVPASAIPLIPVDGTPFSFNLATFVTGGIAPYNFANCGGALPLGLSLSTNGTLSGTLAAGAGAGPWTLSLMAQSTSNNPQLGCPAGVKAAVPLKAMSKKH